MPSSLWSPGKSSSDREAVHFIFPTCYSRPATTSTLYPSIRDCNRALYLSVFTFAAALCMRLQNGNTNSHERERERESKLEVSISFTRYLILPAYAIPFRYYPVNFAASIESLSVLSGISSCHRSEIIMLSSRVRSAFTGAWISHK